MERVCPLGTAAALAAAVRMKGDVDGGFWWGAGGVEGGTCWGREKERRVAPMRGGEVEGSLPTELLGAASWVDFLEEGKEEGSGWLGGGICC